MKIGIAHKLFLSILAAASLALLCMFLIMQWSINRGFLEYLNSLEQGRLEQTAATLEQAYAEQRSWDFLRNRPRGWIMRMMAPQPGDDSASIWVKGNGEREGMPMPPPGMRGPRARFIILDAARKPVFGFPEEARGVNFRPLVHNGATIGYVGLMSPKHFLTPPQLEFLKQQKFALILAAFGIVLVIATFSFPLANRLVRPIRAMAAATRDLASGKYVVRVPVASSDEVGQLARDFNDMALTLEKNEKARRQWIADISHELRTPLAVLRGEIEALLEGIRSTTPEAIRSLHAEAIRLHRLVDDLYQLSLSDLGALTYRKEDLNLAAILGDSVETYRTEFNRKRITLIEDIPQGSEITVFADEERLRQLFANLLDNSLKYTDPGGKLVILLRCRGGRAVIDFEDSPPGVPQADLDRLFDRLYRVEGSRSRLSGGAGLGLAICRNIVEAHAGDITAERSSLGGVMIRVTLPAAGGCL